MGDMTLKRASDCRHIPAVVEGVNHHIRRGCERVVVVPSDVPSMSSSLIGAIFEALKKSDYVLVPSSDGGTACVGASKALPEVLKQNLGSGNSSYVEGILLHNGTVKIFDEQTDIDTLASIRRTVVAGAIDSCPELMTLFVSLMNGARGELAPSVRP
jgi:2-phospho-L-lactate guanylyltransferase (CobY/MobA/RfbA family)